MINPIKPTSLKSSSESIRTSHKGLDFGELLKKSIYKVNQLLKESDEMANKFITGEVENLHQVMIAAEKADLALQLTITIRNKLLDSYNEIMRMQI